MGEDIRYELLYFDLRARAEPIRLLLSYAGQQFKDSVVSRDAWPGVKNAMPLGQIPVLWEHADRGDLRTPQSMAILRHLARTHGLYGQTEREHTLCDIVADTVADARARFANMAYFPNYRKDETVNARYREQDLPVAIERLERLLRNSLAPAAGYFVTAVPTWADFVAFDFLDCQTQLWPGCLEGAPSLEGFVERIMALPSLKAYFAERRPSDFR